MVVARIAARVIAPLALAAVAFGVYLIVHGGLSHNAAVAPHHSQLIRGPAATRHHHRGRRFYVVKTGDTLSAISISTRVSLVRLTELNPGLSPNSLQTGERLRLRQ